MKKVKNYLGSINRQKVVFDAIKDVIDKYESNPESKGYLSFEHETESSIDIRIGHEKFTIRVYILKSGDIEFSVFAWIFDLKSLSRFSDLKLDKYTFIASGNSLDFKYPQTIYIDFDINNKSETHKKIFSINSSESERIKGADFLLEQLEKFVDERDEVIRFVGQ